MAVSKRLRYEVLRRDNHQCRYCGATAPDAVLTVDHVVPKTLGGSDTDPSNLVAACRDCNAGKAASNPDAPLVADVDQRAAQWAQAMTVAMSRRMNEFAAQRARTDGFDQVWQQWSGVCVVPREPNWRDSILRFLAFGLDEAFLASAVESAMGNRRLRTGDVWRYFCGICWTEIKSAQASVVLASPAAAGAWPAASLVVPEGEDSDDEFPIMHMVDHYVDHLLEALGVVDQLRRKIAFRALWDALSETDQVWRGVHPHFNDVVAIVDSEGRPVSRLEATEEFLFTSLAFAMHRIKELGGQGASNGP
jgi:hypothetical protein